MFGKLMQGRYGPDILTYVLLILSALMVNIPFLQIIGMLLLGYAMFRVFSKNTEKRYSELQKFNFATRGIRQKFRNFGIKAAKRSASLNARMKQMKTHIFFKCPKCKKILRLPRNKGKLQVTCPLCKTEFYKKT
jgi:hypothetical protein